MKTTYDRLLGYDDGRLVAIADSCGGEAWSIWHCRQVGHRAAELDTLGANGEAAARKLMRDRLRCTRVVFSRGTEPRPALSGVRSRLLSWIVLNLLGKDQIMFPTIGELAGELHDYASYLKDNFTKEDLTEHGEDFCGGDVRLQVSEGRWSLHTGDSQHDQDHRGSWGCSSISRGASMRECRDVARDLINQAKE